MRIVSFSKFSEEAKLRWWSHMNRLDKTRQFRKILETQKIDRE